MAMQCTGALLFYRKIQAWWIKDAPCLQAIRYLAGQLVID